MVAGVSTTNLKVMILLGNQPRHILMLFLRMIVLLWVLIIFKIALFSEKDG